MLYLLIGITQQCCLYYSCMYTPSASNVMAYKTKELEEPYTMPPVVEPVYDCVIPPQSREKMEIQDNCVYYT